MSKKAPSAFDFRVKFSTRDGALVMNRGGDPALWFKPNHQLDTEFADYVLPKDASEHGVRIVSYTANEVTGVDAVVEWL